MRGALGHGARPARSLDPHRPTVRMRRGRGLGITQDIVNEGEQRAKSLG
jgi:hypothetical protein